MLAARFTVSSLLIMAGASLLLAAFAPSTNADLLRFYDFEPPNGPYGVGLQSDPPALEQGPAFDASLLQNDGTAYPLVNTIRSPGPPIHLNGAFRVSEHGKPCYRPFRGRLI